MKLDTLNRNGEMQFHILGVQQAEWPEASASESFPSCFETLNQKAFFFDYYHQNCDYY